MGFLFGKRPSVLPDYVGLQIQTAVNTLPVPIIYGTPRVTVNLIYFNDFQAVQTKSSSGAKGGGKGLLGGGKGGGQVYNYYATLIMAIGEGPWPSAYAPAINAYFGGTGPNGLGPVIVVFEDQGIYNIQQVAGGETPAYFNGEEVQLPWTFISSNHPADARSYQQTAYLAGNRWPLDASATVPQFNLLIQGIFQGTCPLYRANYTIANQNAPASPAEQTVTINLDMSADPALCIYDFLTNLQYGVGFATQPGVGPVGPGGQVLIDPGIFSSANAANLSIGDNAFQTYCQAAGFGFDVVLNSTEQASSILDRWCKLLGTAVVWTGATLKFIPYWDTPTQANPGYDSGNEAGIAKKYFVPNTMAVFNLTDEDFVQSHDADPVTYERVDTADVYNTVRLDFKDRTNLWNNNVAEAKDENDIELNGIRVDSLGSANEFSASAIAANSAQVIVQRNTSIRVRYTFKLSWEYSILDPMDVVTITDTKLGLSEFPVRITSIEEDERMELTVTAEEFPLGAASPVIYPKQTFSGGVFNTNFPSESVNAPFIFEPTSAQLTAQGQPGNPIIAIGLSASVPSSGQADSNFGGADVWASTDNITYVLVGRFTGSSDMGALTASLPSYSGGNPDNVDTLSVDLTKSGGQLASVTSAQAAGGLTLCAIYNSSGQLELLSYTTATLTAPFQYNLTGLYRGLYGTTPITSTAGQQFIYLGAGSYFTTNLPPQFVGVPIWLKFTAFNTFNSTEQSLSDVTAYQYTPSGNSIVGVPPGSCVYTILTGTSTDMGLTADGAATCSGDFGATTAVLDPRGPFNLGVTSVATWDPANTDSSITLSNGNLTATSGVSAWRSAISTSSGMTSGKWYFRVKMNLASSDFGGAAWCLNTEPTNNLLGNDANGWLGYQNVGGGGSIWHNGGTIATTFPVLVASGDYEVRAYDADNGVIYFTTMTAAGVLNTNWNNTNANPSTNTGGIPVTHGMALQPGVSFLSAGDSAVLDTTTVISDSTLSGFSPYH